MRDAIRHGVIIYIGIVITSLIMLMTKVYINNTLGTEVLGQYELGLSLILLISVFAMFGFHTAIARTIAKDGKKAYPLVRKAYIWVILVSALAIVLANPLVNWFYGERVDANFVLYLSLLLLAICLLNLNMAFFQGRQKMAHVSAIMSIDSFARGGAVAIAILFAFEAQSILLTIGLFALVFELIVTSRIFSQIRSTSEEVKPFRELAHLSFFIFLIAGSGAISTRVSAFVIAYSLDTLYLGWFAMATLFALPLSLLGKTIETVLLPRASASKDFELRKFAILAAGLAIACVPIYYFMAGRVLPILFGSGNQEAIRVLKILSIGYSAIPIYSVFSAFIFGRAPRKFLGKLVTVTFIQALAVAPALNMYLVGRMGLTGAAWATNASLLIQAGLWAAAGLLLEMTEKRKEVRRISS